MKKSAYQGLQKNIRRLPTPTIEVAENIYADKNYNIRIEFAEFTCICPRTGLPDFAVIKIDYVPDKLLIEFKSLKLYFVSYRNLGIFHENAVNKIIDDLVRAAGPRRMEVVGEFNVRGGIKAIVSASYNT